MIGHDGSKHIYPTEPFGHAVCVFNATVTTSAYLQIAAPTQEWQRNKDTQQRDTTGDVYLFVGTVYLHVKCMLVFPHCLFTEKNIS